MKRKISTLIFLCLLIVFVYKVATKESKKDEQESVQTQIINPDTLAAATHSIQKQPISLEFNKLCEEFKNPKEIIEYIKKNSSPLKQKQVLTQNYHYYNAQGEERRIHIIPSDEHESGYELRLFKLDSEGYPEGVENSKTKEELLSGTTPFYEQTITTYDYEDDSYLETNEVNGSVKELSYQKLKNSLTCTEGMCKCTP